MANQEFVVESNRTTEVLEQLRQEIEQTPQEYLLMKEAEDEDNERLSKDEALKYYQALKGENVGS